MRIELPLCTALLGIAVLAAGCGKKPRGYLPKDFKRVTSSEKGILEAKLASLMDALRRRDVKGVQTLMHPSARSRFTSSTIADVERFKGKDCFKLVRPRINGVRNANDPSLVGIFGLGVVAHFREIEGQWYFDGFR